MASIVVLPFSRRESLLSFIGWYGRVVKARVISLQRRGDRREPLERSLQVLGIDYEVIPALDALTLSSLPPHTQVSKARYCIWQSHVLAMRAIAQSNDSYGLILEDDAVLDERIDWPRWLAGAEMEMQTFALDRLQVGHISAASKRRFLKGLANVLRMRPQEESVTMSIDGRGYVVDLGVHRPGTHCYIVSRELCRELPLFNNPVWASCDAFFDRFASVALRQGKWRMGSLRESISEQKSRTSGHSAIDSDNR